MRGASLELATVCLGILIGALAIASTANAAQEDLYLQALPESHRKVILSKFEKIHWNMRPMVEVFPAANSLDPSDPVIVIIQGDPEAELGEYPELVIPFHRMMAASLGVYFYKGYYSLPRDPSQQAISENHNATILANSLSRVAHNHKYRKVLVVSYGKGIELARQARSDEYIASRTNLAFYEASGKDLWSLLSSKLDLPRRYPDRRALYRCSLGESLGGTSAGVDLDLGYVEDAQVPGFSNAYGSAAKALGFDVAWISQVTPWKVDPTYRYFFITDGKAKHLVYLNTIAPEEAWLWVGGAQSPQGPRRIRCSFNKTQIP